MVRYSHHYVCYVESFQMSGTIMGLQCVRMVWCEGGEDGLTSADCSRPTSHSTQ